ncbi:MAG: hypothetical protein ACE5PO_01320 [Candidatus Bathyarchaeia archaeon]
MRKDLESKREPFQKHKRETDKLHQHVKVDESVARKKFRQLEWKLQTNPWAGSEEKDIIDQVAELEKQLAVHGALNEKKAVATQLRAEIQAVQLQIKRLNEEVAAEAKQSQDAHERMIETYSKIENMRRVADEKHKCFIQFKEKLDETHAKLTQLLGERNLLRTQLRKDREGEESRKTMEHQRLIGEQAEEKLKHKRKLTIHEFKVLLDQGKVWNNSENENLEE